MLIVSRSDLAKGHATKSQPPKNTYMARFGSFAEIEVKILTF
jgi:hypothetical protein